MVYQCVNGVIIELVIGNLKGGKSPGVDEMIFEERCGGMVGQNV